MFQNLELSVPSNEVLIDRFVNLKKVFASIKPDCQTLQHLRDTFNLEFIVQKHAIRRANDLKKSNRVSLNPSATPSFALRNPQTISPRSSSNVSHLIKLNSKLNTNSQKQTKVSSNVSAVSKSLSSLKVNDSNESKKNSFTTGAKATLFANEQKIKSNVKVIPTRTINSSIKQIPSTTSCLSTPKSNKFSSDQFHTPKGKLFETIKNISNSSIKKSVNSALKSKTLSTTSSSRNDSQCSDAVSSKNVKSSSSRSELVQQSVRERTKAIVKSSTIETPVRKVTSVAVTPSLSSSKPSIRKNPASSFTTPRVKQEVARVGAESSSAKTTQRAFSKPQIPVSSTPSRSLLSSSLKSSDSSLRTNSASALVTPNRSVLSSSMKSTSSAKTFLSSASKSSLSTSMVQPSGNPRPKSSMSSTVALAYAMKAKATPKTSQIETMKPATVESNLNPFASLAVELPQETPDEHNWNHDSPIEEKSSDHLSPRREAQNPFDMLIS